MEPGTPKGRRMSSWVLVAIVVAVVAIWFAVNFAAVRA
jgi:uncharacterized membrane-anchored protein